MNRNRPITEYTERELVEWIYSESGPTDHVGLPPLTTGPIEFQLRVLPTSLGLPRSMFGDVDALVISRGAFAEARAIEFKRIKVLDGCFDGWPPPSKRQELARGVRQANQLAEAGFAWVWLSVIVQTDTRLRTTPTNAYVTATPRIMDMVEAAIPLNQAHPAVGIYVNELAGPSLEYRSLAGHIIKNGRQGSQPLSLTSEIKGLFQLGPKPKLPT